MTAGPFQRFQSRLLGAETVTIVYRRGRDAMGASRYEQDLAASKGVRIMTNVQPVAVHGNGTVREIELEYTVSDGGRQVRCEGRSATATARAAPI